MIRPVPSQTKWLVGLTILVVVTTIASCTPANQAPVISSLSPSDKQVSQSDTVEIKSVASDPDGDELSYVWSATDGDITRGGPIVFWTAPEKNGDYIITLRVSDGKGGEATKSVKVEVASSG